MSTAFVSQRNQVTLQKDNALEIGASSPPDIVHEQAKKISLLNLPMEILARSAEFLPTRALRNCNLTSHYVRESIQPVSLARYAYFVGYDDTDREGLEKYIRELNEELIEASSWGRAPVFVFQDWLSSKLDCQQTLKQLLEYLLNLNQDRQDEYIEEFSGFQYRKLVHVMLIHRANRSKENSSLSYTFYTRCVKHIQYAKEWLVEHRWT